MLNKTEFPVGNRSFFQPLKKCVLQHPEVFWFIGRRRQLAYSDAAASGRYPRLPEMVWQAALQPPSEARMLSYRLICSMFLTGFHRDAAEHQVPKRVRKNKKASIPTTSSLLSFPNFIKVRKHFQSLFFIIFKTKKILKSPILNIRQISRCFKVPERREGTGHLQLCPHLGNLSHSHS